MTEIMKEVVDKRLDHLWKGDAGKYKWIDLQLDEDKEPLEISTNDLEEMHLKAISDGRDASFFKCDYCGSVWDIEGYPKLIKEPFDHIRCPGCDKIIAQAYPKEDKYDGSN